MQSFTSELRTLIFKHSSKMSTSDIITVIQEQLRVLQKTLENEIGHESIHVLPDYTTWPDHVSFKVFNVSNALVTTIDLTPDHIAALRPYLTSDMNLHMFINTLVQ